MLVKQILKEKTELLGEKKKMYEEEETGKMTFFVFVLSYHA